MPAEHAKKIRVTETTARGFGILQRAHHPLQSARLRLRPPIVLAIGTRRKAAGSRPPVRYPTMPRAEVLIERVVDIARRLSRILVLAVRDYSNQPRRAVPLS